MLHSKIIFPVIEKIYNDTSFKNHTDKTLFNNFNRLTKLAYDYLVVRRKLDQPTNDKIIEIRKGVT